MSWLSSIFGGISGVVSNIGNDIGSVLGLTKTAASQVDNGNPAAIVANQNAEINSYLSNPNVPDYSTSFTNDGLSSDQLNNLISGNLPSGTPAANLFSLSQAATVSDTGLQYLLNQQQDQYGLSVNDQNVYSTIVTGEEGVQNTAVQAANTTNLAATNNAAALAAQQATINQSNQNAFYSFLESAAAGIAAFFG